MHSGPDDNADFDYALRTCEGAIRSGLAKNPNTPPGIFTTLATDTDAAIREAVAAQRRTPASVLAALSVDPDVTVHRAAHANKAASDEIRAQAALLGI